ncbi:MAG: hypothetical protein K0S54_2068 [Alphaproteobacteria bacterium]|nr:hypothetical protein [Alphaproteobacteria bacterium]
MTKTFGPMLAALLLAALAACATAETVRDAPVDAGVTEQFAAPYDRVSAATLAALRDLRINITGTEERPEGLNVQVTKSMNLFSWGEVGRVIVRRSSAPPTAVAVNWEKRSQLQITGTGQTEFSRELFEGIRVQLAK